MANESTTPRCTVLYVDDEPDNLLVFKSTFRHHFNVITALSAQHAIFYLKETSVDVVVSDYKMPDINGIDFLVEVANQFPDVTRILLTAYSDKELIVSSLNHAHIYYYATKPFKSEEFISILESGAQSSQLKKQNRELISNLTKANEELKEAYSKIELLKTKVERENQYLKREIENERMNVSMIGSGKEIQAVYQKIRQVAELDTSVLIEGETGTGKELVAREIHQLSNRRDKPFVKLNCASLPAQLVESELFGYLKGAFTGANGSKLGLFEIADQGTIFLDEIGEMPLDIQPKLLRILQDGDFYKLGASSSLQVNVRIIAATNRVLAREVEAGNFREDLYFRLATFPIVVPPLRKRPEDITPLAEHFIKKYQKKLGIAVNDIAPDFFDELLKYKWPGNVRELEGTIERSIITSRGGVLKVDFVSTLQKTFEPQKAELKSLEDVERGYILHILEKTNWKISGMGGAAEMLSLNHNTLRSKMRKLGINGKSTVSK